MPRNTNVRTRGLRWTGECVVNSAGDEVHVGIGLVVEQKGGISCGQSSADASHPVSAALSRCDLASDVTSASLSAAAFASAALRAAFSLCARRATRSRSSRASSSARDYKVACMRFSLREPCRPSRRPHLSTLLKALLPFLVPTDSLCILFKLAQLCAHHLSTPFYPPEAQALLCPLEGNKPLLLKRHRSRPKANVDQQALASVQCEDVSCNLWLGCLEGPVLDF